MNRRKLVMVLPLILGILILFHQFTIWGYWFELSDIHHETLALVCFAFSLGVVVKA